MTTEEKVQAVRDYAAETTGADQWYGHFSGMTYTSGVLHLSNTCGAHWLLDIIASYQHKPLVKKHAHFQVWELTKESEGAYAIRCWSDTPGKSIHLATQLIKYTDFPEALMPYKLWVENDTILLPEEH